jgi:hypothetical protein
MIPDCISVGRQIDEAAIRPGAAAAGSVTALWRAGQCQ